MNMDEGIPAIISFLLFFLAPYVAVSIVPSWIWLFIVSIGGAVLYDSFDSLDADFGSIIFGLTIALSSVKLWLKGRGNPFGQAFLPLLGVPLLVFCYLTIVMVF